MPDVGVSGQEGGEELGGQAAVDDLAQSLERIASKSNGERSLLANLILHGADGLIEGVDGEVDSTGASGFAEVSRVVVDCECDGSGDAGSEREGRASLVESEGEDKGAAPGGTDLMKRGEGAQSEGLREIGGELRGHSLVIVSQMILWAEI